MIQNIFGSSVSVTFLDLSIFSIVPNFKKINRAFSEKNGKLMIITRAVMGGQPIYTSRRDFVNLHPLEHISGFLCHNIVKSIENIRTEPFEDENGIPYNCLISYLKCLSMFFFCNYKAIIKISECAIFPSKYYTEGRERGECLQKREITMVRKFFKG